MSLPVHQLFLLLGNDKVNLFWAANIPPSEMLCPSSDREERQRFVTAKYCQGKYRCYHALFGQQEALNKVRLRFSLICSLSPSVALKSSDLSSLLLDYLSTSPCISHSLSLSRLLLSLPSLSFSLSLRLCATPFRQEMYWRLCRWCSVEQM